MAFVWEVKMRVTIYLLLSALCVFAEKNGNRRNKPFVADAVGNTLPPPSNVPATVGSPITLLTPDKYEFYTFDESGELVKRLMTLEEIQAIVAAGEDSDGLVTFANDNQPTIAFNFSQPPYTKVHSVVTNVQNVLKAQMEAHKNKPLIQPTLDTPDVSDSWSLILPSIFGNSGVDIVPDKAASSFTPETETIEQTLNTDDSDNSLSKEGGNQILSSTTVVENNNVHVTEAIAVPLKTTPESATSTTTKTTTTTSTTTTVKPSTTRKYTTVRPTTTTSKKFLTTYRPRTTTTSTTTPPTTTTTITPKPTTMITTTNTVPRTTQKPIITTKKQVITDTTTKEFISNDIPTVKPEVEFEKISTFIPISTVNYITERITRKPVDVTKAPFMYASTTKQSPLSTTKLADLISSTQTFKVQTTTQVPKVQTTDVIPSYSTEKVSVSSTVKNPELARINVTTITTQSISPSTTVSSAEFISSEHSPFDFADSDIKYDDPVLPLFDVAQSISQIASDLGNNYQPIPTSTNLLDTTKVNSVDMESKENLDMDIPSDDPNNKDKNEDNFVKISTIDPHPQKKHNETENEKELNKEEQSITTTEIITTTENFEPTTITSILSDGTTIDPILEGSMGDLISQVVNEAPQSILDTKNNDINKIITTEKILETTTDLPLEVISETSTSISIEVPSTTQKFIVHIRNQTLKTTTEKAISVKTEPNKIFSSNDNKVLNTGDKLNEKIDIQKDFVQISVSKIANSSKVESINKNETLTVKDNVKQTNSDKSPIPQKQSDRDQSKEDLPDQKTQNLISESLATFPKIEVLTKLPVPIPINHEKNETVFLSQSNTDKINVGDTSDNTKKNKISEPLPKIDEFKKKIQKVNDEELANDRNDSWKLIPTVTPPKGNDISKDKFQEDASINPGNEDKNVVLEFLKENQGLEVTTKDLGVDVAQFADLCNELAFRYWNVMVENIDKKRSFVLSPYSITSMLAMMFMGARGATSGEMNEILKLDDMVTFNPHFTLKNISDSIEVATDSGIIVSAFVRELFSDRNKGKILTFYKERAQHFYSGHVEEINFKLISDIIRRRTNLLVKKHTWGRISEFMKTNSIVMKPPLAAFSANIFQTDCTGTSVDGRDGEMYFVVSPNVRQRRLVPVPAVVYKTGFLAGYDPVLDATAAALGNTNSIVSTVFLMPGQQGNIVHPEDLENLEKRLLDSNPTTPVWNRVLRTLLPRVGLELQIPRFSHKSVFNVSSTLREMGLKDLFDAEHADLGGLNGPSKDLYLSDMIQVTSFVTCGEGLIAEQHHIEEYPEKLGNARRRTSRWADWDEPRDYQRAFHDPHDVGEAMHLPLHLRPRQARLPTRSVQPARLKFDRPFLFFVRHNPSGMILYVGRYNPRLLP